MALTAGAFFASTAEVLALAPGAGAGGGSTLLQATVVKARSPRRVRDVSIVRRLYHRTMAEAPAVFAAPSLEGARLALKSLFVEEAEDVKSEGYAAVAIDVFTAEDVLLDRAIAHADVPATVRDAVRELLDRTVTRFAAAQELGGARDAPYRGPAASSYEFAGFDCGHALTVARQRVSRLEREMARFAALTVRLYAVPFLVVSMRVRSERSEYVVLRSEDGAYGAEPVPSLDPSP